MSKQVKFHGFYQETVPGPNGQPFIQLAVLLHDVELDRMLPIFIGPRECSDIATAYQGQRYPRPLTHDLIFGAMDMQGYEFDRLVIDKLDSQVFYATAHWRDPDLGETHEMDVRPSDGMTLAIKANAPIFVDDAVLDVAGIASSDAESKRFEEFVEGDLDFRKFKEGKN